MYTLQKSTFAVRPFRSSASSRFVAHLVHFYTKRTFSSGLCTFLCVSGVLGAAVFGYLADDFDLYLLSV